MGDIPKESRCRIISESDWREVERVVRELRALVADWYGGTDRIECADDVEMVLDGRIS